MADSTENNKINSYGVWVKRGPGENEEESPQVNLNDTDLPDLSEDLNDNGDMFITPPTEPQAETPIAGEEKDASGDIPNIDIEGFDGADFAAFDIPKDIATPTDSISDIPDGEVSFDDLLGGGGSDGEISLDAFMSGDSDEISLDDFLDDFGGGSSQKEDDVPDDTPLDINVKFNEDPENQVPTEDIPLEDNSDDAMEEEIAEQDESDAASAEIGGVADEIEAVKLEDPSPISPVATETVDFALEEISLDDFNLDESDDATAAALGASINSAATAEDGLAMFGKPKLVDYDLAITEDDVTQAAPNVEETESPKGQEQNTNTTTVDNSLLEQIVSDLAGLKNEITSIKADLANLKEGKIAIPSVKNEDNNSPEIDASASEIESSIPEMDATDSTPNIPDMPDAIAEDGEATSPFFDEAPTEKPVETQEGFFSDEDDEVVALSGNELDNIVNTSEITEENVEAETAEDEISLESENASELEADAGLPEEPSSENQDVFFSDDDEEIALSGNELDNIVNTSEITEITEEDSAPEEEVLESPSSEEIVAPSAQEGIEEAVETEVEHIEEAEETPSVIEEEDDFSTKFSENSPFGNISDDDMALESTDAPDTGLYMDIDNDALEEPNLDEIEQNVEDSEDISLPKSEELPTEMEGEDKIIPPDESAMISDEVAIDEPAFEEAVAEDTAIEEPVVDEAATDEPAFDEPVAEDTAIEEPVVDETSEDTVIEEPVVDETASEETEYPVADEPPIEEPTMDEATIEEPAFEEPVAEDTVIEEPVVDEAATDEPAFGEPVAEDTVIEEPIADEAPIEEPVMDEAEIDEPAFDEPVAEDTAIEEPVVDETSEDTVIEEPIADEPPIEEPVMDEAAIDEPAFGEPVAEDTVIEESVVDEAATDEPAFGEPVAEDTVIEEPVVDETAEDTVIEEPVVDETASEETEYPVADEPPIEEPAMDEAAIDEPAFEEPVAEDTAIEEPMVDETASTEDTVIEEPVVDETASEETKYPVADEPPIEEPAMDEAAIDEPAFGEPVAEDTAIEEPVVDEAATDEPAFGEPVAEDTVIEEPVADEAPIEEPVAEDTAIEEPVVDETAIEEPIADEAPIEEPAVDETASEDTVIEEPVVQETQNSIDYEGAKQIQDGYINDITSEDNPISETLSNENMDYLSEDKDILSAEIGTTENSQAESSATDLPQNLKSEVKSVLLYMDQLLENLPEEKIVEFAKSDHFATYKKLFTELGLA